MNSNPFAHYDYAVRLQAALAMIADRQVELADIESQLKAKPSKYVASILKTRRSAIQRHIRGWQDYIDNGCPRDPLAQVTRKTYRKRHYLITIED